MARPTYTWWTQPAPAVSREACAASAPPSRWAAASSTGEPRGGHGWRGPEGTLDRGGDRGHRPAPGESPGLRGAGADDGGVPGEVTVMAGRGWPGRLERCDGGRR